MPREKRDLDVAGCMVAKSRTAVPGKVDQLCSASGLDLDRERALPLAHRGHRVRSLGHTRLAARLLPASSAR